MLLNKCYIAVLRYECSEIKYVHRGVMVQASMKGSIFCPQNACSKATTDCL